MRFPLPLCLTVALAACATPREACLSDAAAPYRAALAERADIARALSRGYRNRTGWERVRRFTTCRTPRGALYWCWRSEMVPVTRRLPVDKAALRRRDAEITAGLPRLEREAQRAMTVCARLHPERLAPAAGS